MTAPKKELQTMFRDHTGKKSSKRIIGVLLVVVLVIDSAVLPWFSLGGMATEKFDTLAIMASALLGIEALRGVFR